MWAVAIACVRLSGCGVVCRGPGCEADWNLGRVIVVRGGSDLLGEADAVGLATGEWTGDLTQGTDWQVAASGGEILVGMPDASVVAVTPDRSTAGPLLPEALFADNTSHGLGGALSIAPTGADGTPDLWVGNPAAGLSRGAVSRYDSPFSAASAPSFELDGVTAGDHFGENIAVCGDISGDGLPDLLVSAPWFEAPAAFPLAAPADVPALAGAVFLLRSELLAAGNPAEPWTFGGMWWGSLAGDALGAGLSCDVDLDGDGVADLAMGAPFAGSRDDGAVYFFSGAAVPPSGPIDVAAAQVIPGPAGGWFGTSLTGIGVRGTNLLAVGAPGDVGGAGSVQLLDGFATGVATATTVFSADVSLTGEHFGRVVAVGDVDGDGAEDLLVGAPDHQEGKNGYDAGHLSLWYGASRWGAAVASDTADATLTSNQPFARVGGEIAVVDVDGDGADDIVLATRTAVLP
jgi:hypothetical protein